jgi:hypothetical protein
MLRRIGSEQWMRRRGEEEIQNDGSVKSVEALTSG